MSQTYDHDQAFTAQNLTRIEVVQFGRQTASTLRVGHSGKQNAVPIGGR